MSLNTKNNKLPLKTLFKSFVLRHFQVFFYTLGQLTKTPIATSMTIASLGIALALPAGLNQLLISIQSLGENFNQVNNISLFIKQDATEKQINQLQSELLNRAEINSIEHISPKQALLEFKQHSGFGDAIKHLKNNPLPHVIVVEPSLMINTPQKIEQLLSFLSQHTLIQQAQLDVKWLKRLFSIIEIGKTGILLISTLLALAVILIIGNTIRLAIENRRHEILITKLIGGTNSFIRRPFLYLGFCYGFLGSIIAIVFVDISLVIIKQPILHLSSLYQSSAFNLPLMSFEHSMQLFMVGIVLGILGALVAVNRQLADIEPT